MVRAMPINQTFQKSYLRSWYENLEKAYDIIDMRNCLKNRASF